MAIMHETGAGSYKVPETRLALVHRVIVPDKEYPKEYCIIVTDRRSIFIRQKKTRIGSVLRGEMRYGTALVTDLHPRTLEDYQRPVWSLWRVMLRPLLFRMTRSALS